MTVVMTPISSPPPPPSTSTAVVHEFKSGDTVYLRESAVRGFIESYVIHSVREMNGVFRYTIKIDARPPKFNATVGDQNRLARGWTFELSAGELVTYCEAVDLAVAHTKSNLTKLQSLKNMHCNEGTNG